jgi:hypothetical protein
MTGLTSLPLSEGGSDHLDDSQWAGAARILGPRWSHMSSLTICFLGVQLFWSIEMSYGQTSRGCVAVETESLTCQRRHTSCRWD